MKTSYKKHRSVVAINEYNQSQTNFSRSFDKIFLSPEDKNIIYNDIFVSSTDSQEEKNRIDKKYLSIIDDRKKEFHQRNFQPSDDCEKMAQERIYYAACWNELDRKIDITYKDLMNRNIYSWVMTKFVNFIFSPMYLLYNIVCHITNFSSNILGNSDVFYPVIIRKFGCFLGHIIMAWYNVFSFLSPFVIYAFCITEAIVTIPLFLVMSIHGFFIEKVNHRNVLDEEKKSLLLWEPITISSIIQAKYELIYLRNGGGAG